MSRTTWHPAFIEAIQLEFGEYQDDLVFESEHPLTAEPLKNSAKMPLSEPISM